MTGLRLATFILTVLLFLAPTYGGAAAPTSEQDNSTSDAEKPCTDSSQCEGACVHKEITIQKYRELSERTTNNTQLSEETLSGKCSAKGIPPTCIIEVRDKNPFLACPE